MDEYTVAILYQKRMLFSNKEVYVCVVHNLYWLIICPSAVITL